MFSQLMLLGLVNVVVADAANSPDNMLMGLLKSALDETTKVRELTVMLFAVPCSISIFEMSSVMGVLE